MNQTQYNIPTATPVGPVECRLGDDRQTAYGGGSMENLWSDFLVEDKKPFPPQPKNRPVDYQCSGWYKQNMRCTRRVATQGSTCKFTHYVANSPNARNVHGGNATSSEIQRLSDMLQIMQVSQNEIRSEMAGLRHENVLLHERGVQVTQYAAGALAATMFNAVAESEERVKRVAEAATKSPQALIEELTRQNNAFMLHID